MIEASGLLHIDGAWRGGRGAVFSSIDPATNEAVWTGKAATADDVAEAVRAARRAFPAWAMRPLAERIDMVRAYQATLKAHTDDIASAISRDTGKALWETRAEVGSMMGKVDISIRAQAERAGGREAAMGFGRAVLRHRPHGVMAVLGPFNFPGHLPNGHIVPALLAGDAVVFKPSEETPWTAEIMVRAWEEAGLPAGVLNLVQGGRETGAALLEQEIDGLLFTGSAAAGDHFRRQFVDRPEVILALELGGNNPLIVWDADPDAAAGHIALSAFVTTGQRCSCARRLIVPQGPTGDALVEAAAALSDRLIAGAWNADPEPFMGPLISARAARQAAERVDQLIALGAQVIRPLSIDGAFVTPAILDLTEVSGAPDEEIFAPVLTVRRAADFDQAIALANSTRYGLSAGLVSDDAALWERFLARIRAGVVNWNRPTTGAAGDMPFGGLGRSGDHRPSAYYAADYCAYPVASFEADGVKSVLGEMKGLRP
jgi:succinylglutamic semialdehyde dehydrogenase